MSNQFEGSGVERFDLPNGLMEMFPDRSLLVRLRLSTRNREAVLGAVQASKKLSERRFWICKHVEVIDEGVELRWEAPPQPIEPLWHLVDGWRADPGQDLRSIVDLARSVFLARGELTALKPRRFPLSPLQAFRCGSSWMLLPIPMDGADVADYAHADENCAAWISPDELLNGSIVDRTFSLGAVLHYSLVGDVVAAGLSRNQRFRRRISYRTGDPRAVRQAASRLIEAELAPQFSSLVEDVLRPSHERKHTPAAALRDLETFIRAFEIAPTYSESAETAISQNWIEKLYVLSHREGVSAATLEAELWPFSEVNDLKQLSEEEFLFGLYLKGRNCSRPRQALDTLRVRPIYVSWYRVLGRMLEARLQMELGDWGSASRACVEGQREIAEMANRGGRNGAYAASYLSTLDAICHVKSVDQKSVRPEYLFDAAEKFKDGLKQASAASSPLLRATALPWLAICLAAADRQPETKTLRKEVEALLGNTVPQPNSPPKIPWFEEERVFMTLLEVD